MDKTIVFLSVVAAVSMTSWIATSVLLRRHYEKRQEIERGKFWAEQCPYFVESREG